MDKYIIQMFDLESDIPFITPIDYFKIYRDLDAFLAALRGYAEHHKLTPFEQCYFQLQTDPRRPFFYHISQTYFFNYFLNIYFILSNPVLIKQKSFTNLYHNRDLLPAIADHIIDLYTNMGPKEGQFFNKTHIDKFVQNLNFVPLSGDHGEEYKTYFDLFIKATRRLKDFFIILASNPEWAEHSELGLSQFEPELYEFIFEYNTGLKVKASDFPTLKQWAQKHLDKLMNEANQTCDRLLSPSPTTTTTMTVKEKILKVSTDPSQAWSSAEDMAEGYKACLAKYRHLFIDQHQFKEFEAPGIIILDNPLLTGGYYYKGNFYLNVCNWNSGSFRYGVETLTLHETIPGHHLQIDNATHSPHTNYLALLDVTNYYGFCEGWGLFAEHLGDSLVDNPWNYFGYLQANILRTFRIIAEISLHVEGRTPAEVIELMKEYFPIGEQFIVSEVSRYQIMPGQACAYKIGLEVFKQIIKNKFGFDKIEDFTRPELIAWYKEILWQGILPLNLLLHENGVTWSFDDE